MMKCESETELPRPVRTTLAQLHSRYCQQLNSYKAHIFQAHRTYAWSGTRHHGTPVWLSEAPNSSNCLWPLGSARGSSRFYLLHKRRNATTWPHDRRGYDGLQEQHCGFSVTAQLCLELTPFLLAFTLVLHHIHSVVFLKPTVSSRHSVPPSGSHKCLRFGLWLTLRTANDFIYLHYLLTNYWKQK